MGSWSARSSVGLRESSSAGWRPARGGSGRGTASSSTPPSSSASSRCAGRPRVARPIGRDRKQACSRTRAGRSRPLMLARRGGNLGSRATVARASKRRGGARAYCSGGVLALKGGALGGVQRELGDWSFDALVRSFVGTTVPTWIRAEVSRMCCVVAAGRSSPGTLLQSGSNAIGSNRLGGFSAEPRSWMGSINDLRIDVRTSS